MSDWNRFHTMIGKTPYSDWRVKANVENYFRGANFDPDKLARAIRYVDENQGGIGPFLQFLRSLRLTATSAHFLQDDSEAGSRVLYAAPSHAIDDFLRSNPGEVEFELGPLVDSSILNLNESETAPEPSFKSDWSEGDVICAIIDDTIGFANARFRNGLTSSRIEALWIMDGKPGPSIPRELDVFGGLVLFKEHIDEFLCTFLVDGDVDETALYKHLDQKYGTGLEVLQSRTHGTHVLDLFAGAEMDTLKEGEERPIIAVVLPQVAVQDTSGTHSEFFVQEAVAWINSLAAKFRTSGNKSLPLVTNFSFGLLAGPHDGQSSLEKSLATIPAKPNAAAVVPAGNSFNSRTHAVAEFDTTNRRFEFNLDVSPLNRLSTFVEIWRPLKPVETQPLLKLEIHKSDLSLVEEDRDFGGGYKWVLDGKNFLRTYHLQASPSPDGTRAREMAMIAFLPTDTIDPKLPVFASGEWTFSLTLESDEAEEVDLWIQRGGSVFGHHPFGQQTRFVDGQTAVTSDGTLNALATADDVVSVGGYVHSEDFPPAAYSSAGSKRFRSDLPDVSAHSDESMSVPGISASGTFSGSQFQMSGTSVATPQVARLLADNAACLGKAAKRFIRDTAKKEDPHSNKPLRLGAGRLRRR